PAHERIPLVLHCFVHMVIAFGARIALDERMRLDLIVDNARIWTGDPSRPTASRVGVWQGRIVGVDEQLDGLSAVRVLDASGAALVPGFNDVHAHTVWFGQTLLELN